MGRIAVWAVALVSIGVAAATYFNWDRIALALYERGAARVMAASTLDALPEGLHAGFCGTGAPLADPARGGPCLAIVAGRRLFVVDASDGAAERLALMGLAPGRIEAVLLTHFHSDHIDGLGGLALQRWAQSGAGTPLSLIGPVGVETVAEGFNLAYVADQGYRTAHHGEALMPPSGFGVIARPYAAPPPGDPLVILDNDGLKVTAFAVAHDPVDPAVGYKFEYAGRTIVVSGDTAKSAEVEAMAAGADLLVHEALSPRLVGILQRTAAQAGAAGRAKIFADILDYHATPEEAAETAAAAKVGALALTHIVPPLRAPGLEGVFLGEARARFKGPLWVARDGDIVSLPKDGGRTKRNGGW